MAAAAHGLHRPSRKYSVSKLEALLVDLFIRVEFPTGGISWLDDIDAERFVLYGMGAARQPPGHLDASHFTLSYHKFLFGYLKRCALRPEQALDTDKLIALVLMSERGNEVLDAFQTPQERRRALGPHRTGIIDAIATAGGRMPQMRFELACERVYKLALRRRAHHRTQRLLVLLEQATVDEKELWKEHRGIGELLTELTGSDGKVDGWNSDGT
jgi:hypothetical protein